HFSKNFGFFRLSWDLFLSILFFYILEATESRIKTSDYKTLDQKKITLKNDLKVDYEWILTAELA
ncbi:hypothetical protein ACQJ8S_07405, partial [Helicobacter pylori]